MKKYIGSVAVLLLIFTVISSHGKNSIQRPSTQSQDTVKYLQETIVDRKERFVNKGLNEVLKNLNFTVKSYTTNYGWKLHSKEPIQISLYFDDHKTVSAKWGNQQTVPFLTITFQETVPKKTAMALFVKSMGSWESPEIEYYVKLKIKDISGFTEYKKPQ
ncbi:hypothetical protein ACFQ3S_16115 [Mucilaginibacter terrae]|uniref:hypothetical protein n=1 Tax=Mucilaginibacter terrae TaxID=1955052 RepID=UPI00364195D9